MVLVESGKKYIELANYKSALECFEQATVLDHKASYLWERLGTCYRENRERSLAEFCYSRARTLDSRNFHAAFHWGVLKMDSCEWALAELQFRDASLLNPQNVPTLMNLASVLRQQKKQAESNEMVEKVLEIAPTTPIPQTWKSQMRGH
jgi:tetratricopeptide (TPR) repeat protein